MLPISPTHVTDPTVAGSLSVAGVGSESWRRGPQIANVLALDVATIDGRVWHCSATRSSELFDAVRGGLGQCGVVLRATYPVRVAKRFVRCHHLLYRDAESFVADVLHATTVERADFLSGFFVLHEGRWTPTLVVGEELDQPDSGGRTDALEGLRPAQMMPSRATGLWNEAATPEHPFFRRYDGAPAGTIHPWIEHLFSADDAADAIASLLGKWSFLLSLGKNMIILVGRRGVAAPLFVVPPGEGVLFGIGLFPEVPSVTAEAVLPVASAYARSGLDLGGKRYLSGYLDAPSVADWQAHYGPVWSWFRAMKERYDPSGLLNAGAMPWRAA
jgi:hypothetical protein